MEHAMLQARLTALHGEFSAGRQLLAEHEAKAAAVREQLLRISGAMKVLTELLAQDLVAAGGTTVTVDT